MRNAEYVRKDAENILLERNTNFLQILEKHIEDACIDGKLRVTMTLKCDAETKSFLLQKCREHGYNADAVYSQRDDGFNFEVEW